MKHVQSPLGRHPLLVALLMLLWSALVYVGWRWVTGDGHGALIVALVMFIVGTLFGLFVLPQVWYPVRDD